MHRALWSLRFVRQLNRGLGCLCRLLRLSCFTLSNTQRDPFTFAVGGSWGGAEGLDERAFPARMEVDYVRVWQAEE